MQKKHNKKGSFVSKSEETVDSKGRPTNLPPTGPMKGNPVFFGKEVGVKVTKKLKRKLEEDSNDITDEIVAQSAEEDKNDR